MRASSSGFLSASGAARPRQPGQARLGVGGGLVLQADPARVPAAGQVGQVAAEVEPARAGLAAAGPVGEVGQPVVAHRGPPHTNPGMAAQASPGSGAPSRVTLASISPYGRSAAMNTSPLFSRPKGARSTRK